AHLVLAPVLARKRSRMAGAAASSESTSLNLERLIRVQAMCREAARIEDNRSAVNAYVEMANRLTYQVREEILKPAREDLHREFAVTFQDRIEQGRPGFPAGPAAEAQFRFHLIDSWIQGLLDGKEELDKVRAEAEAAAYARFRSEGR